MPDDLNVSIAWFESFFHFYLKKSYLTDLILRFGQWNDIPFHEILVIIFPVMNYFLNWNRNHRNPNNSSSSNNSNSKEETILGT